MNRRAFIKGLMASCAAVAVPAPNTAFASGGWVVGGIDLASAGDMLSVGYMRDTLTGAFEVIEVSLIDDTKFAGLAERSGIGLPSRLHRFESDGPLQLLSPLWRDVERLSSTSAGESRHTATCASRRAEDHLMRGAA